MTDFKDILIKYMEELDCSSKELADSSGLSAATISRYRSGERIPDVESDNLKQLIYGIVKLAQKRNLSSINDITVHSDFLRFLPDISADFSILQANLNTLFTVLSISTSELAKFLNYDASYISRIKSGERQPADPELFLVNTALFVTKRYTKKTDLSILANLFDCSLEELREEKTYLSLLKHWLQTKHTNTDKEQQSLSHFLQKLDEFNLDDYICVIHFNELKVPTAPFQFPGSKNYFGLKEMMNSELDFLKATVLSKSQEDVIMYSDMPIEEMAKDSYFPKKWMFGMACMLKKGLHLHQIHQINRPFAEMMLGLESWIPMYMTGQISPYYLKESTGQTFMHLLKVSGAAALQGEAIYGHHTQGRYYLTKHKAEISYYKEMAELLLEKASPLMEIFRGNAAIPYHAFLQADTKTNGKRYHILSALPLHTLNASLLEDILNQNQINKEDAQKIKAYIDKKSAQIQQILSHDMITEEFPILSKEEFSRFPIALPLSDIFYEKNIYYTWEMYKQHLESTLNYEKTHQNYCIKQNQQSAFRNIQIRIHEKKWVLVSKNRTPAIHFLIRHPKMRNAFENMIIPIVEF